MNVQLITLAVIMFGMGSAITYLWRNRSAAKPPAAGDARAANSIFQTTFEDHPAGIGFMNAEGRWLALNAKLTSELGYTKGELSLKPLRLLTHPQDWKQESALMREIKDGKRRSYQITKRISRKTGEYGNYRVLMFRCARSGSPILQCIVEPVDTSATQLHRVAAALQDVPDTAAILFDGAGTISGWNLGAERLLGFSEIDIVGSSWASLQPDHAGATAKLRFTAADEHGHAESVSARIRKDGSSIEVYGTILSDMRLGEANEYLEICRGTQVLAEASPGDPNLLAEIADLRDQVGRAAELEGALGKSIAALRAANGEFARKIGVLTSIVRKTIATRNKPPDPATQPSSPPSEDALAESAVPEVVWANGSGDTVYDTIRTLATEARTGTLLLAVGGVERRLIFRDGLLVACTSDDDEYAIGRLLVNAGVINEKQRRSALEAHTLTSMPIGSCMIEMGLITTNDLENVIRMKALRELADAASRERIQYAFINRDVCPPGIMSMAIDIIDAIGGGPSSTPIVNEVTAPPRTLVGRAGARSRVYHDPACATARRIAKKLRVIFDSALEAEAENFRRCERCLSN